jgi:DNA modification methylase
MGDKSVDLILTDPPYDWSEDKKFIYHEQFKRICRRA